MKTFNSKVSQEVQVLFQWNDLDSLSPTDAVKIRAINVQNRPFATNDHMMQNPPSKLVYVDRVLQVTIQGIPVLRGHGNRSKMKSKIIFAMCAISMHIAVS